MIAWLDKEGVDFPQEWRKIRGHKQKIKDKVKEIKDQNPDFNAEQMARKYGHDILRLPPYHCEL